LHGHHVIHGNLKASNVLKNVDGGIKLSNYGLPIPSVRGFEGKPNWSAPEVIEHGEAVIKSDIWSLGCTLIQLITGKPPYWDIENLTTGEFYLILFYLPSSLITVALC